MHESGKLTGRNEALKSDETRTSPSLSLPRSKSSESKQESSYFFAQLLLLAVCSSQCPQTTWCQRQWIQAPQSTWNRHGSLLRLRFVLFSFLDFFKGALLVSVNKTVDHDQFSSSPNRRLLHHCDFPCLTLRIWPGNKRCKCGRA